ncbi:cysteine hydrolase [Alkalibacterium iburiense]|uniref:Cysteine hydrolase n=1 Tax=Alkalibacterium iburiense TaxID=290589 RepID=A0ABN0XHC3_9LACT
MKALINIDYTNDFVADDGALTSGKPGQAIHDKIVELTKAFHQSGDFVVFAIDKHVEGDTYHPESKVFPPHNIDGTEGRLLYGDLEEVYQSIKEDRHVYYTDKTRFSAFQGTDLELKLRERNISELHLVGVVTDICILHTAVEAFNKGFNVVVHKEGVASFNEAGHEWALSHFTDTLGFEVR